MQSVAHNHRVYNSSIKPILDSFPSPYSSAEADTILKEKYLLPNLAESFSRRQKYLDRLANGALPAIRTIISDWQPLIIGNPDLEDACKVYYKTFHPSHDEGKTRIKTRNKRSKGSNLRISRTNTMMTHSRTSDLLASTNGSSFCLGNGHSNSSSDPPRRTSLAVDYTHHGNSLVTSRRQSLLPMNEGPALKPEMVNVKEIIAPKMSTKNGSISIVRHGKGVNSTVPRAARKLKKVKRKLYVTDTPRRLKEQVEVDQIMKAFEKHNLPMSKDVIEHALLTPQDILHRHRAYRTLFANEPDIKAAIRVTEIAEAHAKKEKKLAARERHRLRINPKALLIGPHNKVHSSDSLLLLGEEMKSSNNPSPSTAIGEGHQTEENRMVYPIGACCSWWTKSEVRSLFDRVVKSKAGRKKSTSCIPRILPDGKERGERPLFCVFPTQVGREDNERIRRRALSDVQDQGKSRRSAGPVPIGGVLNPLDGAMTDHTASTRASLAASSLYFDKLMHDLSFCRTNVSISSGDHKTNPRQPTDRTCVSFSESGITFPPRTSENMSPNTVHPSARPVSQPGPYIQLYLSRHQHRD